MAGIRLSRKQLAAFLKTDHEAIRQFETVLDVVDSIAPNVVSDIAIAAASADAKAQQGLDMLSDIEISILLANVESKAQEALDGLSEITKAVKYLESAPALDLFNIQGNASTVTVVDSGSDTTTWPMLATSQTGNQSPATDAGITYDASTNALSTTTFIGALQGNADTATTATNATNTAITDDTTTNATMYLTWVTAITGNLPQKVSSTKVTFNPSTGLLTATGFSGPLTGNVTGNVTGSSGSCTGNSATVTTNANLTGPITSVGNATSVASQTGTGTKFVMDTSPTLVTPALGVATFTTMSGPDFYVTGGGARLTNFWGSGGGGSNVATVLYTTNANGYTHEFGILNAAQTIWVLKVVPGGGATFGDYLRATTIIGTGVYTVATLPTGTQGDRAMVSDALAPVWGAAVAGGGAVVVPVYYAAAWMVG